MWRSFSSCICVFMTCGLQVLSVQVKEQKEYLSVLQEYDRANAITVAVGGDVTCALMEYEQVKCFGRGEHGQLKNHALENIADTLSTIGENLPIVDLAFSSIKHVAIGVKHSCAVSLYGQLQCWGRNTSGELGQTDEKTGIIKFAPKLKVDQVATGDSFTCVLFTNAQVLCFGKGSNGQLGQGSPLSSGNTTSMPTISLGKPVIQICCGLRHACALLDDWSVKCWGAGGFGQLGSGSPEDLGDNMGEMGSNLNPIPLGINRTVHHIECGGEHTCVLLNNGQIKCFGRNVKGQLGLEDIIDRGNNISQMGDNLPVVNLGLNNKATRLAAGTDFSCAVLHDRSVKCWGSGDHGQLLTGELNNMGDNAGEMASLSPINLGRYTYNVSNVYAGSGGLFRHVCVLVSAKNLGPGDVICWGNGQFGQRGIGNNQSFGGLPTQSHNSTLLPLADLGPRRLPSVPLFTELSKDLGSFPCISEVGFRHCRVVNVTKGVFSQHKRISVYPEGLDNFENPPIVLLVAEDNGFGDDGLMKPNQIRKTSEVYFRREGDVFNTFSWESAFIDRNGGVFMELGGNWLLQSCPKNQPYPGERNECHMWLFLLHIRSTDDAKQPGSTGSTN